MQNSQPCTLGPIIPDVGLTYPSPALDPSERALAMSVKSTLVSIWSLQWGNNFKKGCVITLLKTTPSASQLLSLLLTTSSPLLCVVVSHLLIIPWPASRLCFFFAASDRDYLLTRDSSAVNHPANSGTCQARFLYLPGMVLSSLYEPFKWHPWYLDFPCELL